MTSSDEYKYLIENIVGETENDAELRRKLDATHKWAKAGKATAYFVLAGGLIAGTIAGAIKIHNDGYNIAMQEKTNIAHKNKDHRISELEKHVKTHDAQKISFANLQKAKTQGRIIPEGSCFRVEYKIDALSNVSETVYGIGRCDNIKVNFTHSSKNKNLEIFYAQKGDFRFASKNNYDDPKIEQRTKSKWNVYQKK